MRCCSSCHAWRMAGTQKMRDQQRLRLPAPRCFSGCVGAHKSVNFVLACMKQPTILKILGQILLDGVISV